MSDSSNSVQHGDSVQQGASAQRSDRARRNAAHRYWRHNLRYLAILLTIWFAVSFGAGIIFADRLDQIRFFGFRVGFWFAQQGSIFVFVALIFIYVALMNRLDRRFGFAEDEPDRASHRAVRR